jgi:DNA replication protein DnaC
MLRSYQSRLLTEASYSLSKNSSAILQLPTGGGKTHIAAALAKQMSEASQATLEYVPVAGGGACFRITLTPAGVLLATRIAAKAG